MILSSQSRRFVHLWQLADDKRGLTKPFQLFALIQICLVLSACGYGLGKTANDLGADYLARAEKIYYASNIFFIITLALSKASVVALLLRLCAEDLHRRLFRGALGFLAVWMVACVFTIALQCDLGAPWILYHAKCSGLVSHGQANRCDIALTSCSYSSLGGKRSLHWTSSLS